MTVVAKTKWINNSRSGVAKHPSRCWNCDVCARRIAKNKVLLGARDMGRRLVGINFIYIISFEFRCYPFLAAGLESSWESHYTCVGLNLAWAETAKTVWEKLMATFNIIWQHLGGFSGHWLVDCVQFREWKPEMMSVVCGNNHQSIIFYFVFWFSFSQELLTLLTYLNTYSSIYSILSSFSQAEVSSHLSWSGALMQLHRLPGGSNSALWAPYLLFTTPQCLL